MQGSLKRIVYPKYPFTYIIIIKQHIPTVIAAKWIIKPGNYKFFVFCFAIILLIGIFLNLVRVMIEHKNLRDVLYKRLSTSVRIKIGVHLKILNSMICRLYC